MITEAYDRNPGRSASRCTGSLTLANFAAIPAQTLRMIGPAGRKGRGVGLPSSHRLVAYALVLLLGCGGKAVIDGWATPGTGGSGAEHTTSGSGNAGAGDTTSGSGASGAGYASCDGGTPGAECAALYATLQAAFQEAVSCHLCPGYPFQCDMYFCLDAGLVDPCGGGVLVHDRCGCEVGANATKPASVNAAQAAYEQWTASGCGPCQCATPCPILLPGPGKCGGCTFPACDGSCAPAY